MATQIKPAPKGLYDEDFYVWAQGEANLLRDRRLDELNLDNVIEEVADLAGAVRRSVRNRTITIMVHLLKLQHSPAIDPRIGWRDKIRTQRTRLLNDLTPALRRDVEGELAEIYTRARHGRRGVVARPRRAKRCRRTALDLPLHLRSDHRRLAAVNEPDAR